MIYTQFGVPVKLTGKTENGSHIFVEALDGSGWNAWREIGHLKADDGSVEIQEAYDSAATREMPLEPEWKGRLRGVLNG